MEDVCYQVLRQATGERFFGPGSTWRQNCPDWSEWVRQNHAAETDARSASSDSGRIHVGTKLEVAYFDQHRAELDPDKTVMDNLAEGKQEVMVNWQATPRIGLFAGLSVPSETGDDAGSVRFLAGERNRLLLARLFLKPSNLLIL